MGKVRDLVLKPEIAFDQERLEKYLYKIFTKNEGEPFCYKILKRSIDARKASVKVNLQVELAGTHDELTTQLHEPIYQNVQDKKKIVIVGAGPAGYFAALRCLELGVKPIVLERGKNVQDRRRDLADINKKHIVNPDSNYCFGEGGAGTYSDGKLYTRSKKRGDVQKVLDVLVHHGAAENILYEAHPHIGTNKLPKLIERIRETIENNGGEIHFDQKVVAFEYAFDRMKSVKTEKGDTFEGEAIILATGHSSRDIFEVLHQQKVHMLAKPFAIGFRIEHQQSLIDSLQYHCDSRGDYLPAAAYALKAQTTKGKKQRGVFSFCMCPGGFIVPSATSPGELVVNGMSPSRRDGQYANSGIVTSVDEDDFKAFSKFGVLAGVEFQKSIEQKAFSFAAGTQQAPAQRLMDFIHHKPSKNLLKTSYQPGLINMEIGQVFPKEISSSLRTGLKYFGKKMDGYLTNEAQVIGVESRTSSPITIPRDRDTLEHVQVKGLYPCGEGAGYAGGIMSAAIDGEKCAEKAIEAYVL